MVNSVGGGEARFDGWPDASWLQIEAGEGRTEGAVQEVPANRKKVWMFSTGVNTMNK